MIWTLHVDGFSNDNGCGTNLVLNFFTPEYLKIEYAFRLEFKTSNNEVKYEALIAGLRLAWIVGAKCLDIFNDSSLEAKGWLYT